MSGVATDRRLFFLQEIIWQDTGLLKNRTKSAFRHVSGMIGNGGVSVSLWVIPDLVTTNGLAIEDKATCFKTLDYLPVPKT